MANNLIVCVDDNKGKIMDFLERYLMTFLRRSIEYCVNDGVVFDSVAEVLLIELQPTAPSTERN